MASFLVTYDIADSDPDPHGPLLDLAPHYGWSKIIACNDLKPFRQLPNTTLQGPFNTIGDAQVAFRNLVANVEHVIKRKVIVRRVAFFEWVNGSVLDEGEF